MLGRCVQSEGCVGEMCAVLAGVCSQYMSLQKYYLKYTNDKERYDNEMKVYTSQMKFGTLSAPAENSDSKRFKTSN